MPSGGITERVTDPDLRWRRFDFPPDFFLCGEIQERLERSIRTLGKGLGIENVRVYNQHALVLAVSPERWTESSRLSRFVAKHIRKEVRRFYKVSSAGSVTVPAAA